MQKSLGRTKFRIAARVNDGSHPFNTRQIHRAGKIGPRRKLTRLRMASPVADQPFQHDNAIFQ